jgi:hypothetical protein
MALVWVMRIATLCLSAWISIIPLLSSSGAGTASCASRNPLAGAFKDCDNTTGQWNCLSGVTGTDCSHCQEGYYLPRFGSLVVEAKTAKCEKQQDSKEAQTYKVI